MRRLRRVNRSVIAIAIAGTAVLAEVAAHAFPGRVVTKLAASTGVASASSAAQAAPVKVDHHRHRLVAALQAPDSAPAAAARPAPAVQNTATPSTPTEGTAAESAPVESTPTEGTAAESAPVESTPTESAPVQSSPTPVVSGGS